MKLTNMKRDEVHSLNAPFGARCFLTLTNTQHVTVVLPTS